MKLRKSLPDWRTLIQGDTSTARSAFRQLLTGPIRLTPLGTDKTAGVQFEGTIGLAAVFAGVVAEVSSPTGFVPIRVERRVARCDAPEDRWWTPSTELAREMASLTFASWNQMTGWLRAIDSLRRAA